MPFMYRITPSWRCSISRATIACEASASSSRAGKPAFPRYITAERAISKITAAPRLNSKLRKPGLPEALSASAELFSTCCNKRNSRANERHADPPRRAHILAQNVFRAQRPHHVAKRRGRNHKADRLPGQQHQQRIKRKRHQRHARPEPAVPQRAAKKG